VGWSCPGRGCRPPVRIRWFGLHPYGRFVTASMSSDNPKKTTVSCGHHALADSDICHLSVDMNCSPNSNARLTLAAHRDPEVKDDKPAHMEQG
jgi:hypothetical protein